VRSEEGGVRCRFWERRGCWGGGVRARGCTVGCLRKKKLGGAHAVVRGEGGGGLGLGEGGSPREEEGEWAGGRSHGLGEKRKEAGPKSLLRLRSKGVKEN
jgi:hypothetical protein